MDQLEVDLSIHDHRYGSTLDPRRLDPYTRQGFLASVQAIRSTLNCPSIRFTDFLSQTQFMRAFPDVALRAQVLQMLPWSVRGHLNPTVAGPKSIANQAFHVGEKPGGRKVQYKHLTRSLRQACRMARMSRQRLMMLRRLRQTRESMKLLSLLAKKKASSVAGDGQGVVFLDGMPDPFYFQTPRNPGRLHVRPLDRLGDQIMVIEGLSSVVSTFYVPPQRKPSVLIAKANAARETAAQEEARHRGRLCRLQASRESETAKVQRLDQQLRTLRAQRAKAPSNQKPAIEAKIQAASTARAVAGGNAVAAARQEAVTRKQVAASASLKAWLGKYATATKKGDAKAQEHAKNQATAAKAETREQARAESEVKSTWAASTTNKQILAQRAKIARLMHERDQLQAKTKSAKGMVAQVLLKQKLKKTNTNLAKAQVQLMLMLKSEQNAAAVRSGQSTSKPKPKTWGGAKRPRYPGFMGLNTGIDDDSIPLWELDQARNPDRYTPRRVRYPLQGLNDPDVDLLPRVLGEVSESLDLPTPPEVEKRNRLMAAMPQIALLGGAALLYYLLNRPSRANF